MTFVQSGMPPRLIPVLTRVFMALQQKGMDLDQVYTMDQAVAALSRWKEEHHA